MSYRSLFLSREDIGEKIQHIGRTFEKGTNSISMLPTNAQPGDQGSGRLLGTARDGNYIWTLDGRLDSDVSRTNVNSSSTSEAAKVNVQLYVDPVTVDHPTWINLERELHSKPNREIRLFADHTQNAVVLPSEDEDDMPESKSFITFRCVEVGKGLWESKRLLFEYPSCRLEVSGEGDKNPFQVKLSRNSIKVGILLTASTECDHQQEMKSTKECIWVLGDATDLKSEC